MKKITEQEIKEFHRKAKKGVKLQNPMAKPIEVTTDASKSEILEFDINTFMLFLAKYNFAVKYKYDKFTFQGKTILTAYAKYVIEYLQDKFKSAL